MDTRRGYIACNSTQRAIFPLGTIWERFAANGIKASAIPYNIGTQMTRTTVLCIILILAISSFARAEDKWTGADKLRHVGVSAFYSVASYKVAQYHFRYSESDRLKLSIGFTLSLGLAKEIYDKQTPGQTSSVKDVAADILGIAIGVLIVTR